MYSSSLFCRLVKYSVGDVGGAFSVGIMVSEQLAGKRSKHSVMKKGS